MNAVIISHWIDNENNEEIFDGGIYENVTYKAAAENMGKDNISAYIPLTVSGRTYKERQSDLTEKAKEYQSTWSDFCGWSYGELAIIQEFFESNGRRYGLIKEFRENGII